MVLTKAQQSIWERSRAIGAGEQAVVLSDAVCGYLVGRIVLDLALQDRFPEVPVVLPELFDRRDQTTFVLQNVDSRDLRAPR
jgi:hypothetical protein